MGLTEVTCLDKYYHYYAATPRTLRTFNYLGLIQPHYANNNLNFHKDICYSIYMLESHYRRHFGYSHPNSDEDLTAIVLALPLCYKRALNKVATHERWCWNRHFTDFTLAARPYRPLPQALPGPRLLRPPPRLDPHSR